MSVERSDPGWDTLSAGGRRVEEQRRRRPGPRAVSPAPARAGAGDRGGPELHRGASQRPAVPEPGRPRHDREARQPTPPALAQDRGHRAAGVVPLASACTCQLDVPPLRGRPPRQGGSTVPVPRRGRRLLIWFSSVVLPAAALRRTRYSTPQQSWPAVATRSRSPLRTLVESTTRQHRVSNSATGPRTCEPSRPPAVRSSAACSSIPACRADWCRSASPAPMRTLRGSPRLPATSLLSNEAWASFESTTSHRGGPASTSSTRVGGTPPSPSSGSTGTAELASNAVSVTLIP